MQDISFESGKRMLALFSAKFLEQDIKIRTIFGKPSKKDQITTTDP